MHVHCCIEEKRGGFCLHHMFIVYFLKISKCIQQVTQQSGSFLVPAFQCQFFGPGTGPHAFLIGVLTS